MHPEEEELEDFDEGWDEETDTILCPECNEEVYEEASQCPYCGSYVLEDQFPSRPPWVVLTAVFLLVLFACYWLLPLF